ncbi:unnamed protein product [Clonostachys rhizophaga]|uniref:Zn(2)-C6 fungal-type domain-containing protein n=1 Tax=Clonostachys rhizophaga TaxID=160324 RepID=A0A9N9VX84_9HYPO|nr:unnamed protein product [Clonostachys rhizophaga]
MRKLHSKSRLGCKVCKVRRVKCDETRPSCKRCSQTGRTCSFLADVPVLPPSIPSPPNSSSTESIPSAASSVVFEPLPNVNGPGSSHARPADSSLEERYGSLHLYLLYLFEHQPSEHMRLTHPGLDDLLKMMIKEAFKTPYVMDQVLAYSAAHESVRDQNNRDSQQLYATEATRLQTRALTLYNNANPQVSACTCLPMFIFTSLLAHHTLFDVLSDSKKGLGAVIDGLTRSIPVHRGLMAVAAACWSMFSPELQKQFLQTCLREPKDINIASDDECDSLKTRLEKSDLSASSIAIHLEAVELLQRLFDNERNAVSLQQGNLAPLQDWLVGVSAEFVSCIQQRRPESLVILAFYAVMLHRASDYWFVGDLGKCLIYLINDQLGPAWEDWLAWPNGMVGYHNKGAGEYA